MIKVGFDAKRFYWNQTGLGNHSRSTIQGLARWGQGQIALNLFASRANPEVLAQDPFAHQYTLISPQSALTKPAWREWGMTRDIRASEMDIYHGLSAELPVGIRNTQAKSIVTIHDLIAIRAPEQFPAFDSWIYRKKLFSAVKRADWVLTTSEATRADLLNYAAIDASRVIPLYQSPAPAFFEALTPGEIQIIRNQYQLPSEYIIQVGSVIERKRLRATLKMLALPHVRKIAPPLVVIGSLNSEYARQAQADVQSFGLQGRVIFKNDIQSSDLPAITQGAKLALYPSVYEGFGIPIVEAMLSRVPVIASPFTCSPEVLGPGGAIVDPDQTEAYAQVFLNALENEMQRAKWSEAGSAFARERYSPEALACQLIHIYKTALQ